jgi:hypothetical protein
MSLFAERFNYLPYIGYYNYRTPQPPSLNLSDELTIPSTHVSPINSSRNQIIGFLSTYMPFQWFLKLIKWENDTNRIENARNIILDYDTEESDYDDTLTIDSEEKTQLNRNYSPKGGAEYIVDDDFVEYSHHNYHHPITGRHLSV